VAANQPVKRADLIVVIGISGKGLDQEIAALAAGADFQPGWLWLLHQ
jgi:hypothetical protein